MSSTFTITDMVADIKSRIPIGLTTAYVEARLNQSFYWIEQQDSFVWELRFATRTVDNASKTFTLPTGIFGNADPGKVMVLYTEDYKTVIPFVPPDRWPEQWTFNQQLPDNTFSAWTIYNTGTEYKGRLATNATLSGVIGLTLFYHLIYAPITTGDFFPTPDNFDYLIVDLTEAEIKRRYSIAGWQDIQNKATEEVKKLIPQYRSSKRTIEGMAEVAMNAQEAQLNRAE